MIFKVLLVALSIPLLINLFAPLLILRTQRILAKVSLIPVNDADFFHDRSDKYQQYHESLIELGFGYVGSSQLSDSHSNTFFSAYLTEHSPTIATLVTISSAVEEVTYIEFSQLYVDGTMVDVNNSSAVSAYPQMSAKNMVRFPEVTDPTLLYEIFVKFQRMNLSSNDAVVYRGHDCFRAIESFLLKESDELVQLGYCHNEIDSEGKRRLTLWGAYRVTWNAIFPGKNIKNAVELRKSRRWLENA